MLFRSAQKRAVGREISLSTAGTDGGTASVLTRHLLNSDTSPTFAARRAEMARQLAAVIGGMSPTDREILLLRHFEELTNNETADVLGIHKAAATNRYLRALRRLRESLSPAFEDHAHDTA